VTTSEPVRSVGKHGMKEQYTKVAIWIELAFAAVNRRALSQIDLQFLSETWPECLLVEQDTESASTRAEYEDTQCQQRVHRHDSKRGTENERWFQPPFSAPPSHEQG
jgi:hypothetical protein